MLVVYALKMGKRLFSEGYSFISLWMRWGTPSCVITYTRSCSLASNMIAKSKSAVASLLVILTPA